MQKRIAFYTLGCKVNAAETDVLSTAFYEKDYRIVGFKEKSDIYVINTCTVTHQADSQCRQAIRRARKNSPGAIIAVIGCYAQSDSERISQIQGVDIVLGTRERFEIFDVLTNNECFTEPVVRTDMSGDPFEAERTLPYGTSRTRAFLKVQDGCSYKCSYCIIPQVRGPGISRKSEDIIDRIKYIRDAGFKEIVTTAVNLGEFENGKDYRLIDLLREICEIPGIPRLRLTSIEPNCLSEDIIRFIAGSDIICSHFHIPLQSGSDHILKLMKRRYRIRQYEKVLNTIMKYVPDAAIGADVMVGFPGENNNLFEESFKFIEKMPLTYLHVFRYSPRTGTDAAHFQDFVPLQQARERSQKLLALARQKKDRFLYGQVGKTAEVLFESKPVEGGHEGFTSNYARVWCGSGEVANRREQVQIIKKTGLFLEGRLVA